MASVCQNPRHLLWARNVLRAAQRVCKLTRTNAHFSHQAGRHTKPTQFQHLSFAVNPHIELEGSKVRCLVSRPCGVAPVKVTCSCQVCRYFSSTAIQRNQGPERSQQTYDKSEVDKFSRLSADWWNEQGEFGALHSLNVLRVPLVRDGLLENREEPLPHTKTKPLTGLKIVDVGCGGGILSEPLARLGAHVIGVDASAENIAAAEAHLAEDPDLAACLSYRQCLVEDLAAEAGPVYDGVVASEILEHVADARVFVQACCDLLKPGGSVFFTTMNRTNIAYALAVVAAERILRIVPDGAHDWNKFVTPEELSTMVEESGAEVSLVHGMMLNPVSLHWHWTTDTSINYSLHAVKAQ